MNIKSAALEVLDQLKGVLDQLAKDIYRLPIDTLSNATLGQHFRHTIEFFICLQKGCGNGVVNYDDRERNELIEINPEYASQIIDDLAHFIQQVPDNLQLRLEANYGLADDINEVINTNFSRELSYNIEHAIHHMAILKIGLAEVASEITIPEGFGVAVSTLRHRQEV